jgi:large subunit ribosomal protein L4
MKVLARKSAFSDKAQEQAIIVVDNLIYEEPKTSKFVGVLKELGVLGKKVLLVVDTYTYQDEDKKIENTVNLLKSARNIKNVSFQTADSVNTYEIMRADYLIIQKDALKTIDRVNG